jgi:phosphoribosylformylglycinamidine (FGAM) synthase PurS component
LKKAAVINLEKYLELVPDAEDKEEAEELIKDLTETEDKE